MEATITTVKLFLMDIIKSRHVVKLDKNLQSGVIFYWVQYFPALQNADTSIFHIMDMYTNNT